MREEEGEEKISMGTTLKAIGKKIFKDEFPNNYVLMSLLQQNPPRDTCPWTT